VLADLLKRFSVPAIYLNVKQPHDCVYPDDVANGARATNRLIELGHRRIAFLSRVGKHYSIADRSSGYEQAMHAHGLTPRLIELPQGLAAGDPALRRVPAECLQRGDRPTGIVTYGLKEADLAVSAAIEIGRAVPRDLSVICAAADNTTLSGDVFGVTSVELPWFEVGRQAVNLLMRKIAAPRRALDSIAVPPRFRDGRTTGPAPR